MSTAAPILDPQPANIARVARILLAGEVAVIPTDTVYGLAGDAFNPAVVRKILAIKGRPAGAPLPVLLATASDMPLLVRSVPRPAWSLIERFWPGPLTLVLPARDGVDPGITAGGATVAVRVPGHRVCLELLESVGVPLIGTSANRSGAPPATTAAEAAGALAPEVEAILADGASQRSGVASTVVSLGSDWWHVERRGSITVDQIAAALGSSARRAAPASSDEELAHSAGWLDTLPGQTQQD